MTILIAVAHPDDEVLGVGASAAKFTREGVTARACIACGDADARTRRPRSDELMADIGSASSILGLQEPILGDFPNIRLNTVPHIELVQFFEQAIVDTGATTLFTHHPRDLNDDHRQVSAACQAAARLFQRRPDVPPLRALYFMEILSSSEWSVPGSGAPFEPDAFFEIGENGLERKLEALAAYRGVMREYPHPRSREALQGLAAYRGAQAGMKYAEGFQTAYRAITPVEFTG